MGAGTAVIVQKSIIELDPGDVAFQALGLSGLVIVIVAGWTTANANLYRAGLAAQAIFTQHSRAKTTLVVGLIAVCIACFPFVFNKMLPLLTYAGLLVVPVGAIVFTEHFIFPKLGFTRYWAMFRNLSHSTPAVASWGLGLAFGFGLNVLDVMSFYYLFIPTWFFTSVVYIVLAKQYGAAEKYPEEQAKMEAYDQQVEQYHDAQAKLESVSIEDKSLLTKVISAISLLSLGTTLALAFNTMFLSANVPAYESNRDLFFDVGFICTIIYFASAYWVMQQNRKVAA
jgi:hypothetical protein